MYETPVKDRTVLALVLSIIATFCTSCFPLGVVAIVFAALAMSAKGNNDFAKMESQQRTSLILSIIALVIGFIIWIAYFAVILFAGLSEVPR